MTSPACRLRLLFGAASLVAVLAGCWTANAAEVPVGIWGRMMAAWTIGAVTALWLSRGWRPRPAVVALAVIALLMLDFADAGIDGVHRWIAIGPVRLNVAAIALPITIVALAGVVRTPLAMLVIMLLLTAQPDASQATGFGVAAVILLAAGERDRSAVLASLGIALLAAATWFRPDPLASVPEVEGIVALAWGQSPVLAIGAVVALGLAAVAPIVVDGGSRDTASRALAAYMLVTAGSPAIGAFQVPLIGMSVSPIIGWWLGIGALAALSSRTDQ